MNYEDIYTGYIFVFSDGKKAMVLKNVEDNKSIYSGERWGLLNKFVFECEMKHNGDGIDTGIKEIWKPISSVDYLSEKYSGLFENIKIGLTTNGCELIWKREEKKTIFVNGQYYEITTEENNVIMKIIKGKETSL